MLPRTHFPQLLLSTSKYQHILKMRDIKLRGSRIWSSTYCVPPYQLARRCSAVIFGWLCLDFPSLRLRSACMRADGLGMATSRNSFVSRHSRQTWLPLWTLSRCVTRKIKRHLLQNLLVIMDYVQVRRRTRKLVYPEVLACKSEPHLQHVVVVVARFWGGKGSVLSEGWILANLGFVGAGSSGSALILK